MKSSGSEGAPVLLVPAGVEELEAIQSLAGRIWRAAYPGIISDAQIEHMLERMYDREVMRREMTDESVVYFLVTAGEKPEPAGFAALGPGDSEGEMLLHKLYLDPDLHGRGYGTEALRWIEDYGRAAGGADSIALRVNKENEKAIRAYERNGYEKVGEICSDIGAGFVMDDYWMRKSFGSSPE